MPRLRFLQTTPSDNPEYPFQPGQIIAVEVLTKALRRCVANGMAEILPESESEAAVVGPSERAVLSRPKPRGEP
jgi:hypothetical protein